jgi:hypothetical protein
VKVLLEVREQLKPEFTDLVVVEVLELLDRMEQHLLLELVGLAFKTLLLEHPPIMPVVAVVAPGLVAELLLEAPVVEDKALVVITKVNQRLELMA